MHENSSAPSFAALYIPADDADDATVYPVATTWEKMPIREGMRACEKLEAAAIRHCLAGEIVNQALGSDLVLIRTMVIVADEQLDSAAELIAAADYLVPTPCAHKIPGFAFASKGYDPVQYTGRLLLIPASYLYMDLCAEAYAHNIVLLTEPRCRMPYKLHYIDTLIATIVEQTLHQTGIDCWRFLNWRVILIDFVLLATKPVVARVPPEDLLFLELYEKVITRSARKKVCIEWAKIRRGETTVASARTRIPRMDLRVAAVKAKYDAQRKLQAETAGGSKVV